MQFWKVPKTFNWLLWLYSSYNFYCLHTLQITLLPPNTNDSPSEHTIVRRCSQQRFIYIFYLPTYTSDSYLHHLTTWLITTLRIPSWNYTFSRATTTKSCNLGLPPEAELESRACTQADYLGKWPQGAGVRDCAEWNRGGKLLGCTPQAYKACACPASRPKSPESATETSMV